VWGLARDVEVTTEANPESVTFESLKQLRAAGFTRISLGMQSAAPGVLALLDRRHTPGRAVAAAREAHDAGFDHVNLDLIYGTPGETPEDFAESLAVAVAAGVDHVSAYALIVEDGTRLAARMRRGEVPYPSDDVAADRYLAAEATLSAAGFSWYEVSNWARSPQARCRHNLLYWTGGDWWGLGPGAHSHVGGVRWWNVKHPSAYAARLAAGTSPGQGREVLSSDERRVEDVMLRLRLSDGLPLDVLDDAGRAGAARAVDRGLLARRDQEAGRAVLTLHGRLLADAVVRDLLS
jgi:coproporphyrinogen III oxidase-like Fe-S oxidoreductase